MHSYPIPGVYWQEVFPAPEPTFLTAVPVFLGYALAGPVNVATPIRLWPQYEATFGAAFSGGYLSYAVRGFFENGGLVAYVVRLDDEVSLLDGMRRALTAVVPLDTVDLVCAPDVVRASDLEPDPHLDAIVAVQQEILAHCRQLGDRFAILDAPFTRKLDTVVTQSTRLRSSYGALYHPWLRVTGPDDAPISVPPCGHLAGIFSRSDRRVGVHKAPANEEVEGILDLYTHLSAAEQARLHANSVNYARAFTGRGVRVWGARTLSAAPEWQQINVRRLFLTIGRWLERFMAELPFEPNNPRLWVRIMREVSVYLNGLFQQGALRGETPDQSYYVKCDAETNPAEVREGGMVVTEIGLAAAVPGEFIVVRVVHGDSGVSVTAAT